MTETSGPTYVIALEEGPEDSTIHTFTDAALWVWLNTEVVFPGDDTRASILMPGTDVYATATIGSSTNDLAQELVRHPNVTEVEFDDYEDALDELTARVGADHVYTGLWY
jgi:hypothetical protein